MNEIIDGVEILSLIPMYVNDADEDNAQLIDIVKGAFKNKFHLLNTLYIDGKEKFEEGFNIQKDDVNNGDISKEEEEEEEEEGDETSKKLEGSGLTDLFGPGVGNMLNRFNISVTIDKSIGKSHSGNTDNTTNNTAVTDEATNPNKADNDTAVPEEAANPIPADSISNPIKDETNNLGPQNKNPENDEKKHGTDEVANPISADSNNNPKDKTKETNNLESQNKK